MEHLITFEAYKPVEAVNDIGSFGNVMTRRKALTGLLSGWGDVEPLTRAEKAVVKWYTGNGAYNLWNAPVDDEEMNTKKDALEEVIRRRPLTQEVVVYRGLRSVGSRQPVESLSKGGILTCDSFLSTSVDYETAAAFASTNTKRDLMMMRIVLPQGTEAMLIHRSEFNSRHASEYEVLLNRGYGMRLVSITDTIYSFGISDNPLDGDKMMLYNFKLVPLKQRKPIK